MGPELIAALAQLGMMVGGSLLQMNAQQDAADERRQVMNRQLARDSAAQQKGAQQVLAEGQNFAPEQRQQAIQQAETQAFDQSQKDLQTGGITLVNRGYGCFLINAFLHKQFHSRPDRPIKWTKPFPFRVDQVSAAAPGQILKTTKRPRQNLFVVTTDGRIWELQNTR